MRRDRRLRSWTTLVIGSLIVSASVRCGPSVPTAPPPDNADATDNGGDTDSSGDANDNAGESTDAGAFVFPGEQDDPTLASLTFEPDQLIVQTLPGADDDALAQTYEQVGATVVARIDDLETTVLSVDPNALTTTAAQLDADEQIEAVQKNYLYEQVARPNDPERSRQSIISQMGLEQAWSVTKGRSDVIIAILDTGVSTTHPDLKNKLLDGFNAAESNADARDVHGHGTAVAGVAAADTDNGRGIAGVAWNCSILPVRVSRADGRAASRVIAEGILWSVRQGAQVINVSFGPLQADKTVLAAAERARNNGALVFIASGNDGRRKSSAANPAALFIGSVDADNRRADFSTHGGFLDFVAPGVRLLTTDQGGDYLTYTGTSFSCPAAAGVAALIWSVNPDFRPVTVEEILEDAATDLGKTGRDDDYGRGLIYAGDAVPLAKDRDEPADRSAPSVSIASPSDGSKATGRIQVRVTASDRNGVADVVLSVDGEPYATDTASPYRFTVDTKTLGAGAHTLSVIATDTAGNASSPRSVQIDVSGSSSDRTPPEVTVISPTEGAKVIGTVEIRVLATDNERLVRIDVKVDGRTETTRKVSGVRAEVSTFWRTSNVSSGSHTIQVTVTDAAGRTASQSVHVRK